jgi:DNA-binding NtrC family response regulator
MTTRPPHPAFAVLLVDDEPAWLDALRFTLERAGVTNVVTCAESARAPELVAGRDVGLVLLDLTMPPPSGEELLARLQAEHPGVAVIVVSGLNQVETAVRCMRAGAFDYFVKTAEEDRLVAGVQRAIRMLELQRENRDVATRLLSGALADPGAFAEIVTRSRAMQAVFSYVEAVARSAQPLLVAGESGVGKELVARAVHRLSGRSGPLVAVKVAGRDDHVFADTLFGHVRGAFTGADRARGGMAEEAADGTLFLDEIGDLGLASQVKLLRLVQEGEYFPVGGDRPKRLRARVVAATHQDLEARQASGAFRRDLYYRLRTHQVRIPPLRERREDVPLLLEHFAEEAARELGRPRPAVPARLAGLLAGYPFPGNVRELRAMVYDAVSLGSGAVLDGGPFAAAAGAPPPGGAARAGENPFAGLEPLPTLEEAAALLVEEAMARAGGHQTTAARLVGLSQPALSRRLKSLRGEEP